MSAAKCPMCGASVRIPSNPKEGNLVFCDGCDAELEIVTINPITLDWPLDDYVFEGEDDEYDDDEYGDY